MMKIAWDLDECSFMLVALLKRKTMLFNINIHTNSLHLSILEQDYFCYGEGGFYALHWVSY